MFEPVGDLRTSVIIRTGFSARAGVTGVFLHLCVSSRGYHKLSVKTHLAVVCPGFVTRPEDVRLTGVFGVAVVVILEGGLVGVFRASVWLSCRRFISSAKQNSCVASEDISKFNDWKL